MRGTGKEAERDGKLLRGCITRLSPLSGTGLLNLTVSSFQKLSNYIPGNLSRRRKEKDFYSSPCFFQLSEIATGLTTPPLG